MSTLSNSYFLCQDCITECIKFGHTLKGRSYFSSSKKIIFMLSNWYLYTQQKNQASFSREINNTSRDNMVKNVRKNRVDIGEITGNACTHQNLNPEKIGSRYSISETNEENMP